MDFTLFNYEINLEGFQYNETFWKAFQSFKPWILLDSMLRAVLLMLLLAACAQAATIEGEIYEWSSLSVLTDIIVEVNSTPKQTFVSKDGSYSFSLPPGSYEINAAYDDGLSAKETVEVRMDGDFRIDLLLVPQFVEEDILEGADELGVDKELRIPGIKRPEKQEQWGLGDTVYLLVPLLALLGAIIALKYIRSTKPDRGPLPEDLDEVIALLRKRGGRMNQKELRIEMNQSESKMSLMVTDLEDRGLVKRVKRGRANMIRFVEKK